MKSIIHTPTSNLDDSLAFYQKLQFQVVSESKPTVVTDGKAVIEINPERFARAGVKLFQSSWKEQVAKLEKITAVKKLDRGFLLSDPSGVWIYLIEDEPEIIVDQKENCFGLTGNFSGLSLETTDMQRSVQLWDTLGFAHTMGTAEQGFIAHASEDGLGVAFMGPLSCPHLFFNPSMTYFNGKNNLEVIDAIRKAGIPITEEITHFNKEGIVDNIIIRDPGGYGFFIFND